MSCSALNYGIERIVSVELREDGGRVYHTRDGLSVAVWKIQDTDRGHWFYRATRWVGDDKMLVASNLRDEDGHRSRKDALVECLGLHALRERRAV